LRKPAQSRPEAQGEVAPRHLKKIEEVPHKHAVVVKIPEGVKAELGTEDG
jgi:hypothetical protein